MAGKQDKTAMWPGSYRAIQAWGIHLRSFEYFIRGEQMKAFSDGAPLDAVYHSDKDGWVRLKDCHTETQKEIKHIMDWMR